MPHVTEASLFYHYDYKLFPALRNVMPIDLWWFFPYPSVISSQIKVNILGSLSVSSSSRYLSHKFKPSLFFHIITSVSLIHPRTVLFCFHFLYYILEKTSPHFFSCAAYPVMSKAIISYILHAYLLLFMYLFIYILPHEDNSSSS